VGLDLGAMTILLYAMREREIVLDIFEQICGARMTLSYLRIGGVRYDFNKEIVDSINELLEVLPGRLDEYETVLIGNRVWIQRNEGVGVISAEDAINLSLSGPALRASGVKWDIRKDEPYLVYDRFDFDIPTGENGDCLDRFNMRFQEVKQSMRIIKQAVKDLPDGPFNVDIPEIVPPAKPEVYKNMENLIHHFKYVSAGFKVPKGEVYSAIEAPKGELGVYIVSDGTEKPYRLKLRVPTFVNLQTINHMSKGRYLADVIAIVSSLDPVFGECDK
jgi:NADH-quinone oxidoreductase subunit D